MEIIEIIEAIIVVVILLLIIKSKKSKRKIKKGRILFLVFIELILVFHISYLIFWITPSIELKGIPEIVMQPKEEYVELGAKAKLLGKDISEKVEVISNLDTSLLGEYIITYKINDRNRIAEVQRKVKVIDTIAPSITLKGKSEVNVPEDVNYAEEGYTAIDNYDGDISDKVIVNKREINEKEYELEYIIQDSSGNSKTEVRKIKMVKAVKNENVNKNGVIYLTFDDGPSLDITPKLLDILKEENVKATFFILNYDKNKEVLVKRIVQEGHSIGIHGFSHNYSQVYSSVDTYMENITKLEEKILVSTGVNTKITRFPGGSSNTVSKSYSSGIMTILTSKVLEEGYRYFDWNVASGDSGDVKTAPGVYNNVTKRLSKNKPNMVLMHDFSGNTKTLNAIRDIIQYGKNNGYTFEAIGNDTPMITQRVAN